MGPFRSPGRSARDARSAQRPDRQSSSTTGGTTPGFVSYVAGKMAVIGLTRALANDLGDANITVNALGLGLTRTA